MSSEADCYIGLSKKDSQNKADHLNHIFRLIRIDDKPMFSYPEDIRTDRVCIEIENGLVVKAVIQ